MLTYEEKLTSFIDKNSDLIDKYDNLEWDSGILFQTII